MLDAAQLLCTSCGWTSVCGPAAMLDYLRQAKMARHGAVPDLELLGELFRAAAAKIACPECARVGLAVSAVAEENDEQWGMARKCASCGRPIPRARLEVLPGATLCSDCQAQAERGEQPGEVEYCPRCGTAMTLRQSHAAGLTRYVLSCPKCRGH